MSDIETVDELIQEFIKEMPILENGYNLIESYARNIDESIGLSTFKNQLDDSYKQFEKWLNQLFEQEGVHSEIVALNFGLFESEDRVQLYISGSTEWEIDDDDWASSNDYFPEGRYANITLYRHLYSYWDDQFYGGLFLTVSSTIIFANTYLQSNPSNFPQEIVFATGFDDGDLYNFSKKVNDNIVSV